MVEEVTLPEHRHEGQRQGTTTASLPSLSDVAPKGIRSRLTSAQGVRVSVARHQPRRS